jgi:hypothetical protein
MLERCEHLGVAEPTARVRACHCRQRCLDIEPDVQEGEMRRHDTRDRQGRGEHRSIAFGSGGRNEEVFVHESPPWMRFDATELPTAALTWINRTTAAYLGWGRLAAKFSDGSAIGGGRTESSPDRR